MASSAPHASVLRLLPFQNPPRDVGSLALSKSGRCSVLKDYNVFETHICRPISLQVCGGVFCNQKSKTFLAPGSTTVPGESEQTFLTAASVFECG